jgi:hypothetical protein
MYQRKLPKSEAATTEMVVVGVDLHLLSTLTFSENRLSLWLAAGTCKK